MESAPKFIEGMFDRLTSSSICDAPFPHAFAQCSLPPEGLDLFLSHWDDAMNPANGSVKLSNGRKTVWLGPNIELTFWAEVFSAIARQSFDERTQAFVGKVFGLQNLIKRIEVRLCEDQLPTRLPPHIDHPEKLLALVLYLDAPCRSVGTALYNPDSTLWAQVAFVPGALLAIFRTPEALHGGEWAESLSGTRKTIHVFFYRSGQQKVS